MWLNLSIFSSTSYTFCVLIKKSFSTLPSRSILLLHHAFEKFHTLFFLSPFFFFWLCWVFVAVHRLSLVVASGGNSSLRCVGFSCYEAWALGTRASVVVAQKLSSCDSRASLLCFMWDLLGPGIEPVSPALAGGFLTTAPPDRKSVV